jgi:hypothetical protein
MTVTSKVVSRRTPDEIILLKEEQAKSRKSVQQELLAKLSTQKTNLRYAYSWLWHCCSSTFVSLPLCPCPSLMAP